MKRKRDTNGIVQIEIEDGDCPEDAYTHRMAVGERRSSGRDGRIMLRIEAAAVEALGPHGRLLSASKHAYTEAHPDHEVLFNACLFEISGEQIWFGDIDLTLQGRRQLQRLADELGTTLCLTPERPYRSEGLPPDPEGDPEVRLFRPSK